MTSSCKYRPTVKEVTDEIAWHLDEIGKLFKNPKLTVLVRNPDLPDGDVILSDDDPDAVIASLEKHRGKLIIGDDPAARAIDDSEGES